MGQPWDPTLGEGGGSTLNPGPYMLAYMHVFLFGDEMFLFGKNMFLFGNDMLPFETDMLPFGEISRSTSSILSSLWSTDALLFYSEKSPKTKVSKSYNFQRLACERIDGPNKKLFWIRKSRTAPVRYME